MGSGGGGTQTSTNEAAYPAEFKPLAKGAAKQILGMQGQLPLAGFAPANPAGTAGISPFQRATMNMAPGLLNPTWGLDTMMNMGQPMNTLATNAVDVGNQNSLYSNAINALASGGFGTGAQSFPNVRAPAGIQMQGPNFNAPGAQPNVMGGGPNLVPYLSQNLIKDIPQQTPTLAGPMSGQPASDTPVGTPTPTGGGKGAPQQPGMTGPGFPSQGTPQPLPGGQIGFPGEPGFTMPGVRPGTPLPGDPTPTAPVPTNPAIAKLPAPARANIPPRPSNPSLAVKWDMQYGTPAAAPAPRR